MVDAANQSTSENSTDFDYRSEDSIVRKWLEPVADSKDGCGQDLAQSDPRFAEMERAAEEARDDQNQVTRKADWETVSSLAEELMEQTRDLRVAVLWLRAGLHLRHYAALADGLRLIEGLLDKFWNGVHPAPEPGEDGSQRKNQLIGLGQPGVVLKDVKQSAILNAGRPDVIDVGVVVESVDSGENGMNAPARNALEDAIAEAVKANPAFARVGSSAGFWMRALQAALIARFDRSGPDLGSLPKWVRAVESLFQSALARPAPKDRSEGTTTAGGESNLGAGQINTRKDAIRVIDLVCAYLDKTEPSNPAQFLLRRARGMLDRNFMELLKDIAPGAFSEVAKTMGIDPSKFDGSKK